MRKFEKLKETENLKISKGGVCMLRSSPKTFLNSFVLNTLRSSTCPLTSFFWLLSHVIYLKLTKVLYECLLSQAESWAAELLFLSLNNWGLNFLQNKCSQSSQIYLSPEKLRKVFTFQSSKFLNDKLTKTSILPNFQVPNSFFLL